MTTLSLDRTDDPMLHSLLLLAAVATAATVSLCGVSAAEPPKPDSTNTAIVERLDAILQRLDSIEQRLTQVEAKTKRRSNWNLDRRGVMRLPDGRPVGIWGIDGPFTTLKR